MRSPEYFRVERAEDGSIVDIPAPQPDRRHWVNPMWMTGSFLAGVVLAVAHHVYYAKLNNTFVGSAARQQWPLRFGTTFAFLFKACLANATGIAYIQWVWRRCRQKAIQMGTIDAALAVDRNIFMFLNLDFLIKFPFAVGLMVIFWCIPISSLITPATLGVASMPDATLHTVPVYQPSISSFENDAANVYSARGTPPTKLQQMFTVIAGTGELLRLGPPGNLQNISYSIDLMVPIVRCQASNENARSITAKSAFDQAIFTRKGWLAPETSIFHPENLTFTADATEFYGQRTNGTFRGYIGYYAMQSNLTTAHLGELWIAVADVPEGEYTWPSSFPTSYSASFYTCVLRNASVTTNVSFVDNVQSLHAIAIKEMDMVAPFNGSIADEETDINSAFWNYKTYADLLFNLLSGFTMLTKYGNGSSNWRWNMTIDQTVFSTAQDFAAMTAVWKYGGLEDPETTQRKNLTAIIEEFSLNASWSLMAMPRYNNQVQTQVTQTLWHNKYAYNPKNLFIAYGCSILACFLTVLAGGYAFYTDGDSINTHFSSISRVMQGPDIAALFSSETTNTKVLEKKVAKTRIQLLKDGNAERFRVDAEKTRLSSMWMQEVRRAY